MEKIEETLAMNMGGLDFHEASSARRYEGGKIRDSLRSLVDGSNMAKGTGLATESPRAHLAAKKSWSWRHTVSELIGMAVFTDAGGPRSGRWPREAAESV